MKLTTHSDLGLHSLMARPPHGVLLAELDIRLCTTVPVHGLEAQILLWCDHDGLYLLQSLHLGLNHNEVDDYPGQRSHARKPEVEPSRALQLLEDGQQEGHLHRATHVKPAERTMRGCFRSVVALKSSLRSGVHSKASEAKAGWGKLGSSCSLVSFAGCMYCGMQISAWAYRKVGAKIDEGADGNGLASDACREDLTNHHPRDGAKADLQFQRGTHLPGNLS